MITMKAQSQMMVKNKLHLITR